MEQNTLLHGSQLFIAVINITLYYNDYGPAYTDTVGWLSVATNTMTHHLRTSDVRVKQQVPITKVIRYPYHQLPCSWW